MSQIAADEGAQALWKGAGLDIYCCGSRSSGATSGFPAYYLRCGGHTVMMFIFVEAIRDVYMSR